MCYDQHDVGEISKAIRMEGKVFWDVYVWKFRPEYYSCCFCSGYAAIELNWGRRLGEFGTLGFILINYTFRLLAH
jgi:hypothetical protein